MLHCFTIKRVNVSLQFTGLKMRNWRVIDFLAKHFAADLAAFFMWYIVS